MLGGPCTLTLDCGWVWLPGRTRTFSSTLWGDLHGWGEGNNYYAIKKLVSLRLPANHQTICRREKWVTLVTRRSMPWCRLLAHPIPKNRPHAAWELALPRGRGGGWPAHARPLYQNIVWPYETAPSTSDSLRCNNRTYHHRYLRLCTEWRLL